MLPLSKELPARGAEAFEIGWHERVLPVNVRVDLFGAGHLLGERTGKLTAGSRVSALSQTGQDFFQSWPMRLASDSDAGRIRHGHIKRAS